jgi:hypothetical protein
MLGSMTVARAFEDNPVQFHSCVVVDVNDELLICIAL